MPPSTCCWGAALQREIARNLRNDIGCLHVTGNIVQSTSSMPLHNNRETVSQGLDV